MGTVSINSLTINNSSGTQGCGPFRVNTSITSADLGCAPWTNNSMYGAFAGCYRLNTVTNISPSITNMAYTFYDCRNLVNVPSISNSVTNLYNAFSGCKILVNAPSIPNSVIDMSYAFYGCNKLSNISSIPDSVMNMYMTFRDCNALVNAPTLGRNLYNLCATFHDCHGLTTAPIIPNNVSQMQTTFFNCTNLSGNVFIQSVKVVNAHECLGYTSLQKNVYIPYNASLGIYTNTYNAFNNAGYKPSSTQDGVTIKENPFFTVNNDLWWDSYYNVVYKYLGSNSDIVVPNIINGHNISCLDLSMFNTSNTITSIDFNNVLVSGNMYNRFNNYQQLQSVSNLNKNSNIDSMYATFQNCYSLVNAPEIPNSVTNMTSTFAYCNSLVNAPNIPNSVTTMINTFSFCRSLVNAPNIPNSVTYSYCLFYYCNSLVNAPILGDGLTDMTYTFGGCTSLTGNIYIMSKNIANVYECFRQTTLSKNVYIPFTYENGVNTLTYNSFMKYYGSGQNGVALVNYTALYS